MQKDRQKMTARLRWREFLFFLRPAVLCLAGALGSCDFSSKLNRDILQAQQQVREQEYRKATEQYLNILQRNPSEKIKIRIYFHLAQIDSLYLNESRKAAQYLEKILELSDDPQVQVNALERSAEIYFDLEKNYAKASEYYQRLLQFVPRLQDYDQYEFRAAKGFSFIKKYPQAKKIFKRLTERPQHQFHQEAFYQWGLIEFYQENWKKSIELFKSYVKRGPAKANVLEAKLLIANAYETAEELQKAYDLYYSLLGEYPNSQVIQDRLQSIYDRRVARKR